MGKLLPRVRLPNDVTRLAHLHENLRLTVYRWTQQRGRCALTNRPLRIHNCAFVNYDLVVVSL